MSDSHIHFCMAIEIKTLEQRFWVEAEIMPFDDTNNDQDFRERHGIDDEYDWPSFDTGFECMSTLGWLQEKM